MKKKRLSIPSVNFHLWEPCNFRCKFCFATFQDVKRSILPKGHLSREDSMAVVKLLAEAGFEKITFAGGEPTLCPWIGDLIKLAKNLGMTTNLVTNGWAIIRNENLLSAFVDQLDWITISIDSISQISNEISGRGFLGKVSLRSNDYKEIIERARENNVKVKVNTVVSNVNWNEELWPFISEVKPLRWKVFQVLPVSGQNDQYFQNFSISDEQFTSFLKLNAKADKFTKLVAEDNRLMRESYVMIDPAGRFFDNVNGAHHYSSKILQVGIYKAFQEVYVSEEKFILREGLYDWK
jgi:radical S-adenosyl methionine domain-containing protein 2